MGKDTSKQVGRRATRSSVKRPLPRVRVAPPRKHMKATPQRQLPNWLLRQRELLAPSLLPPVPSVELPEADSACSPPSTPMQALAGNYVYGASYPQSCVTPPRDKNRLWTDAERVSAAVAMELWSSERKMQAQADAVAIELWLKRNNRV